MQRAKAADTAPHTPYQLLYVSTAAKAPDAAMLRDILSASRRNNPARGVTGLLLQADTGFLQILEGPRAEVEALYARIAEDPRHYGARRLIARPVAARAFGDWAMGFYRPDPDVPPGDRAFALTQAALQDRLEVTGDVVLQRLAEAFYEINSGDPTLRGVAAR